MHEFYPTALVQPIGQLVIRPQSEVNLEMISHTSLLKKPMSETDKENYCPYASAVPPDELIQQLLLQLPFPFF